MSREKRIAPITVHAPPLLKRAIAQVARAEDRPASRWLQRLAESHPSVQLVLQQIEGKVGTQ